MKSTEIPYTTADGSHYGQGGGAGQGGQDPRDQPICATRRTLSGLKLTIDLKRGVDPEKLMQKLVPADAACRTAIACNFNILIAGNAPGDGRAGNSGGVDGLAHATASSGGSIFQLQKKQEKLHLLQGSANGSCWTSTRPSPSSGRRSWNAEVVPNLMIGFGIDEIQANYVAEIKLRNINKEYILKQTRADRRSGGGDRGPGGHAEQRAPEAAERHYRRADRQVAEKYGQPRRTEICCTRPRRRAEDRRTTMPDYPVHGVHLPGGVSEKDHRPSPCGCPASRRFKEGDSLAFTCRGHEPDTSFWSLRTTSQVYKARLAEFKETKASELGDFLASKLEMEPEEQTVAVCLPEDYRGFVLFAFANGKVAKVDLAAYDTKSNRRPPDRRLQR